jgi:tRNA pseudouridine55 synthase
MDGVLIIDKPAGITSHDVVAKVRRILKTKRVGHTGTLDPFATGVMVVLVGKATRLAQFLDKDEKEYEAVLQFGFETDTGDVTGERKSEGEIAKEVFVEDIESVLPKFRGQIQQVPPMYSAKKIAGKKLYEHARKGETVEREAVAVDISKLEVLQDPAQDKPLETLTIRVACSAGTYIRTLAEDIARTASGRAHLIALRRTRAGRFTIEDAVEIEAVSEAGLLPVGIAVEHLPSIKLTPERVEKTLNGLSTRLSDPGFSDQERVRMVGEDGSLIAVGTFSAEDSSIKPKVVLV